MEAPPQRPILGFLGWFAVSFVTAAIGAAASVRAEAFYTHLALPPWAPPAFLFGPVWTVLYTLMAIAAGLVWLRGGFRARRTALTLFLLQLVCNAPWSWLFFVWHRGALALADIVVLWLVLGATLFSFWRTRALAGALLAPYFAWVSFAGVLNYACWQLNPQVLG